MDKFNIIKGDSILEYADEYNNAKSFIWNGNTIIVREMIKPDDVIHIVDIIMSSCMNDKGMIMPELIEFEIKSAIILMYSNVQLPDDFYDQYRIIYSTDLYESIENNICKEQVNDIKEAVRILISKR